MSQTELNALFINCTLKKSPAISNTEGLWKVSKTIFQKNNVNVDELKFVDHDIAFGVYEDMRQHGWEKDEFPKIYERVQWADILIIGTPIWLGDKSSICTQLIERLYANSGNLNENGQYAYYGKVGGCIVTGNEDGAKHLSLIHI